MSESRPRQAPRLWSIQDLSEFLGVPVKTLYQWRTSHRGPRGVRIGRYIRYLPEDVMTWLDELERQP